MKRPSDDIIENVLLGLGTKDEASWVAGWLKTDEGQDFLKQDMDHYFSHLKEGFEEVSVPHAIPSEKILAKISQRTIARKKRYSLLKIVAVLIPLFFAVGLGIQYSKSVEGAQYVEVYVPKGERMELTLEDGTHIHLNADTKLKYPKKFASASRQVTFEGEAYFDVTKDAERPFIIGLANDTEIKVLGTSFNLEAYPEDKFIQVALDEGKVQMISASDETYELRPQEKLTYTKSNDKAEISQQKGSASQWLDNIIAFDNTSLSDVINTLSRWYNIEFAIVDKQALKYTYTLTTQKVPLKEMLSDIEKISPVTFTLVDSIVRVDMIH